MAVRTVIMGAAGRDFHDFNVFFRDNDAYDVIAFTAAQIPDIAGRRYPASLAGRLYPEGIPIVAEEELAALIAEKAVDQVIFAYSDVSYEYVMHRASLVNAAGATFVLLGRRQTTLPSPKPVVAVCAVRTGAGKSQTTRHVVDVLAQAGKRVVVVRHPMPYGDLERQRVQRFAALPDLEAQSCTIEECEEYEPHIAGGHVVYAGVDYAAILAAAAAEADIIVWDGGNNDLPFYETVLHIVVADPLRAGHELTYHPSEANLRVADVVVINKVDSAKPEDIATVERNARGVNPKAIIVRAESPLAVDDEAAVKGRKVLCVEDGPTVTHGGMAYGAAWVAAKRFGAAAIVDPRPYAVGALRRVFDSYPHIGPVLPAMGYGAAMVGDLRATVEATPADVVLSATPIDFARLVKVDKPIVRVRYELKVVSTPTLADIIRTKLNVKP